MANSFIICLFCTCQTFHWGHKWHYNTSPQNKSQLQCHFQFTPNCIISGRPIFLVHSRTDDVPVTMVRWYFWQLVQPTRTNVQSLLKCRKALANLANGSAAYNCKLHCHWSTHWDSVTKHICLVICLVSNQYLNQCWFIFNWMLSNKHQGSVNKTHQISFTKINLRMLSAN